MFKSKFEHKIFILLAPNEPYCTTVRIFPRYSDGISVAIKEYSDVGFELYESRLVCRSAPEDESNA